MSLCQPLFVCSYIHLQWSESDLLFSCPTKNDKRTKNRTVDIMKHVNKIIVVQTLLPSSLPCQFTASFNASFQDPFLRL